MRRSLAMPDSPLRPPALLSDNLCSVPPCLQPIFSSIYGVSLPNQAVFAKNNNFILFAAVSELQKAKYNFNANTLFELMCSVLAQYKKNRSGSGQEFIDLFNQLFVKNHPNSADYPRGNLPSTLFSVKNGRGILNFMVLHNALVHTKDVTEINLGQFCERAERYLDIHLIDAKEGVPEIMGVNVAKIKKEIEGGYSHQFHGLNAACPDTLFYVYDILLDLILRDPMTMHSEEIKKLHAVFLLTFLIGSNAPMYRDGEQASGGSVAKTFKIEKRVYSGH